MTVLVTGGRGVIGRWVVQALADAGQQVHAVSRAGAGQDARVLWHHLDLLDERARRDLLVQVRPTALVHLAWETTHGQFWHSPLNAAWEDATVDLVRRGLESGLTRAVLAGTCAEYDWTDLAASGGVCSEDATALAPATPYGAAKLRTLERVSSLPGPAGWLAWARVFSPYGPGEAPGRLLPSVVLSLLAGKPAQVASPHLVRDYLHAREVGRAFAALLASGVAGPVNVASGVGVSLGDVAAEAARLVGRPDLVRLGGSLARVGDPDRLVADVARLQHEVGFRSRTGLADGLRDVVDWWRSSSPVTEG